MKKLSTLFCYLAVLCLFSCEKESLVFVEYEVNPSTIQLDNQRKVNTGSSVATPISSYILGGDVEVGSSGETAYGGGGGVATAAVIMASESAPAVYNGTTVATMPPFMPSDSYGDPGTGTTTVVHDPAEYQVLNHEIPKLTILGNTP